MNTLAKKVTYTIISFSNSSYSNEDIEIFVYGIECFFNSAATDIILFVWGLLTNTLLETVCWLIIFCFYRNHAGGIHANSSEKCILLSSLLGISTFIPLHIHNDCWAHIMIYSSYTFSSIVCCVFAPIKVTKNSLSLQQKLFLKLESLLIIVACIAISFVLPTTISISISYSLLIANILILPCIKH